MHWSQGMQGELMHISRRGAMMCPVVWINSSDGCIEYVPTCHPNLQLRQCDIDHHHEPAFLPGKRGSCLPTTSPTPHQQFSAVKLCSLRPISHCISISPHIDQQPGQLPQGGCSLFLKSYPHTCMRPRNKRLIPFADAVPTAF